MISSAVTHFLFSLWEAKPLTLQSPAKRLRSNGVISERTAKLPTLDPKLERESSDKDIREPDWEPEDLFMIDCAYWIT